MSKGSRRPKKSGYKPLATNEHDESNQVTDPTVQTQNVKAAKVYVFGETDVAEEELYNGGMELTQLRPRGRAKAESRETERQTQPEETFIEVTIGEGDTLQKIALKYGCPVSELKRVNNLIKDQEFYALKILKVPVKRHGLLTEIVQKENEAAGPKGPKISLGAGASGDTVIHVTNPSSTDDNWDASDDGERTELLVRTVSIRGALSNQGKEARDFLQKMDTDIKKIVSSTKTRKESLDDVTSTLTRKSIQPFQKNKKLFSDVDCGLSWWGAVVAIFVIGLLTPLLYFIYMEYGNGNESSHNSQNTVGPGPNTHNR